jgi:hypothetical protein
VSIRGFGVRRPSDNQKRDPEVDPMMPYQTYQLWMAERQLSPIERRATDARLAVIAGAMRPGTRRRLRH